MSVISEERSELNNFLDDIIHQRDELLESQRKKRDEKAALDRRFDDVAREVPSQALSQMSSDREGRSQDKVETGEEKNRKMRKVLFLDSDDEELKLLRESMTWLLEGEWKKM